MSVDNVNSIIVYRPPTGLTLWTTLPALVTMVSSHSPEWTAVVPPLVIIVRPPHPHLLPSTNQPLVRSPKSLRDSQFPHLPRMTTPDHQPLVQHPGWIWVWLEIGYCRVWVLREKIEVRERQRDQGGTIVIDQNQVC